MTFVRCVVNALKEVLRSNGVVHVVCVELQS